MLGTTNISGIDAENLSISLNGSLSLTYNGNTKQSLNITAASIGAALANHNHDGIYMSLNGGTMRNWITFNNTDHGITWSMNTDWCKIFFKNTADADTDSYMCFRTGDNGNEYFKWDHQYSGTMISETWMELRESGLKVKGNIYANQTALATMNIISTEKSISSDDTKLWAY